MDNYQPRLLKISLKEDKNKTVVGKTEIDLSQFTNSESTTHHSSFKKGSKMKLKIKIKGKLLRVNNQRVVSAVDVEDINKDDAKHYYINGNKAYKTMTETNLSDDKDTNDDISSHEGPSEINSKPPSNDSGSGELFRDDKGTNNKLDSLETLLIQKDSILKGYENEIDQLQHKIDFLQSQNRKYKKQCEIQEKQLISLKNDGKIPVEHQTSEIEKIEELKERNINLENINMDLSQKVEIMEKKIHKLHKKLKKSSDKKNDEGSDDPAALLRKKVRQAMQDKANQNSVKTYEPPTIPDQATPNTMRRLKDEATAVELLSLKDEISLVRTIIRIVYHADQVLETEKVSGLKVPATPQVLFDWLTSENALTRPQPKLFSTIIDAINGSSSRKVPATALGMIVYWLSSVVTLLIFLEKYRDITHIAQFISDLENLTYTLYNKIISNFVETVASQLVMIFTSNEEEKFSDITSATPKKAISQPKSTPINSRPAQLQNSNSAIVVIHKKWTINDLLAHLDEILLACKRYALVLPLIKRIFESIASCINRIMFNTLISRSDMCTAGNAFQIKMTLSNVEDWFSKKTNKAFVGDATVKLKPLYEAVTLLTLDKNILLQHKTVLYTICPSLSMHQIRHLVSSFQPDKLFSEPVSPKVLELLDRLCEEAQNNKKDDTLEYPEDIININTNLLDLSFTKLPLSELIAYPRT